MENLTNSLAFGTHVIACKTSNGLVIPEFYRQGLLNKEYIINAYRDFAPIYDLTLKRTYQVIFPAVKKQLMGLPKECNLADDFCVEDLTFDPSLTIIDIFASLPQERKKWFVNEFYQLLCLEHGLYPARNFGENSKANHPYMLFLRSDFTAKLDFHYGSLDEYIQEYYENKKGDTVHGKNKFYYIIYKTGKLPKTKNKLFRAMYCGARIEYGPLRSYYYKNLSERNKMLRKLEAMMERRVKKYGFVTD